MTDLFISYSRKDKEFVRKLHTELTKLNSKWTSEYLETAIGKIQQSEFMTE